MGTLMSPCLASDCQGWDITGDMNGPFCPTVLHCIVLYWYPEVHLVAPGWGAT
jgi:hypothetical protein